MATSGSRSAHDRQQLGHPVIDADGHWLEPVAIYLEYLADEAGPEGVESYRRRTREQARWYDVEPRERASLRIPRGSWWTEAGGTLDRATAMLPGLLHERLGDFGIDFALVYPTLGLITQNLPDDIRQASCRALNRMSSELFAPYADRMTPVATVPVYSPQEAIEEATFAVRELGMRAIMIGGRVKRRAMGDPNVTYIDTLGLNNDQDYDPFWARCVELGVAITDHGGSGGWPDRQSTDNYVFNHLGHFAQSQHAGCRGVFLGGVTRRFPSLNFGFLEGGVGWACQLLFDLVEHFERRNVATLREVLRPGNIDLQEFRNLYDKYAGPKMAGKADAVIASISCVTPFLDAAALTDREGDISDEFALSEMASAEQIVEEFRRNFYFGCESDDVMTAVAFDRRLGALLKPVFSSDIGHFDVLDMTTVLHEAWELVEHGLIDAEQFKEFTFTNAALLHTANNPDFFKGTVVERAVTEVLQSAASPG
jgi:predicted TIM-barrel fold metal-dependent hydrolase